MLDFSKAKLWLLNGKVDSAKAPLIGRDSTSRRPVNVLMQQALTRYHQYSTRPDAEQWM